MHCSCDYMSGDKGALLNCSGVSSLLDRRFMSCSDTKSPWHCTSSERTDKYSTGPCQRHAHSNTITAAALQLPDFRRHRHMFAAH